MAHHNPDEVQIEVTSRHEGLSDRMKSTAVERVQKLVRFHHGVSRIEVVVDDPHGTPSVEILTHIDRNPPVVAKEADEHFRAALDRAADKVEVQLRKLKERKRSHKGEDSVRHGGDENPEVDEETYDDAIRKDLGT